MLPGFFPVTDEKIMNQRTGTLLIVLAVVFATSITGNAHATPFSVDSYSLEYPTSWTYKQQLSPDGSQLHMFMGQQQNSAIAYCHTTQQPLLETLSPRASKMNEKQRAEFFANSDGSLLFSLYSNLASAQGFRLLHAGPAIVGKSEPAFTADFSFRVPQGFVYRVRSHYTFWKSAQLSIWCQAVSRSETASDNAFHNNLAEFQRFVASVRIKQ